MCANGTQMTPHQIKAGGHFSLFIRVYRIDFIISHGYEMTRFEISTSIINPSSDTMDNHGNTGYNYSSMS